MSGSFSSARITYWTGFLALIVFFVAVAMWKRMAEADRDELRRRWLGA